MKDGSWQSSSEQPEEQVLLIEPHTNKPTLRPTSYAFSEQQLFELLQTAGRVQIDYRRKGRIPRA